jgi:hypothetical protein
MKERLQAIFTRNTESEISYLAGSVDDSIDKTIDTINEMGDIQSEITSATGEYLDEWAQWFGIYRNTNETDDSLRTRTLASVTNRSATIPALIDAVKRVMGDDTLVEVSETYKDLRIFNVSTYSGTGKYQDTNTTRLGVVQININKRSTQQLVDEINRTRASGISVILQYFNAELLTDSIIVNDSMSKTDHSSSTASGTINVTDSITVKYIKFASVHLSDNISPADTNHIGSVKRNLTDAISASGSISVHVPIVINERGGLVFSGVSTSGVRSIGNGLDETGRRVFSY